MGKMTRFRRRATRNAKLVEGNDSWDAGTRRDWIRDKLTEGEDQVEGGAAELGKDDLTWRW